MIHVKVTMLPTEFSVDQESLEPILIDNGSVQCVIQVKGFVFCILYLVFWWSTVCSVSGGNILYSFCETFPFIFLECWYQINFPGMMLQSRCREERESFLWPKLKSNSIGPSLSLRHNLCKMVHGKLIRTCLFLPQRTLFKNHFNLCATFVKTNLENWLKLAWFSWWFFWLFFWQSEVNLNWPSCIWEWFRSLGNFHRNVKIWPRIQFW